MNNTQRLEDLMRRVGLEATKEMYAKFVREVKARVDPDEWWPSQGYERVSAGDETSVLPDGRVVVRDIRGAAWALLPEIHVANIRAEIELAVSAAETSRESETKSVAGTDGLSEMTCPKCGDTLEYSMTCTACAAGRAGYRHRYSCVHGHVDFVSKEKI